jgi:hypothetical protein
LILLFATIGVSNKTSLVAYALSVAVVSLLTCLVIQTGEYYKPGLLAKIEKPVSLFLFFWWAMGTGIMTFAGPFLTVSNGYFSAWLGLIAVTHWAIEIDTEKIKTLDTGHKTLMAFGAASALVMFACIPEFTSYPGQAAWGFVVGLLSVCGSAVLFRGRMLDEVNAQQLKVVSIIMFSIWSTVAGILTFNHPFEQAGNGYFGCWGGFLCATYFMNYVLTREDDLV